MRINEFIVESVQQTISLEQLYQGNYPDRDDIFWDYVRPSDFKMPLSIQVMPRHKVMIMMTSQYNAEHIDEVVDMLEPEQLEIVQQYENDPGLSNKIIVVSENRIIDGNHRALAAALRGVSIKYVELSEEEELSEDEPVRIRISPNAKAKEFISKVYGLYPGTWQNNHVMVWGEGEAQQFCMFELEPSMVKKDAAEIKWFQAYPLRGGIGARGMQELQRLAKEDGVTLTLFPWDKGQVSQSALIKFYKKQGFQPVAKGSRSMYWTP